MMISRRKQKEREETMEEEFYLPYKRSRVYLEDDEDDDNCVLAMAASTLTMKKTNFSTCLYSTMVSYIFSLRF